MKRPIFLFLFFLSCYFPVLPLPVNFIGSVNTFSLPNCTIVCHFSERKRDKNKTNNIYSQYTQLALASFSQVSVLLFEWAREKRKENSEISNVIENRINGSYANSENTVKHTQAQER